MAPLAWDQHDMSHRAQEETLRNTWEPLLMVNWGTREVLRCRRMGAGCLFGLGSDFNGASEFFLNIYIYILFFFAVFFPSGSLVSCMEHLKIAFITMDQPIIFIWQTLPSQFQKGAICICLHVFKRGSHLTKEIPVQQACFCLVHSLTATSRTGPYILPFTP